MFVVIFEVQPKAERWDDYLALAKLLKPKLETIDGFIDNERFKSKRDERRVLSLSTWRDEKAVIRWRTHGEHHGVQEKGRSDVFEDYHLRVGEITADTAPPKGLTVVEQRFDATTVGAAKVATITEVTPAESNSLEPDRLPTLLGLDTGTSALVEHEIFESIYNPGKRVLLASWRDATAARAWRPSMPKQATVRHRQVRIIRDYGMFERREAPQYFPEVQNPAGTRQASRQVAAE
jgi:heme-degrading monooxygenase HmoA